MLRKFILLFLLIVLATIASVHPSYAASVTIGGTVGSTAGPITVPATGGITTINGIKVGATYTLEVSDFYYYRYGSSSQPNAKSDAQWHDPVTGVTTEGLYSQRTQQPKLNGKGYDAYDVGTKVTNTHIYHYRWKADNTKLDMKIGDTDYSDNTRSLTVKATLTSLPTTTTAPTANAGPDKQINLPTSSVSLSGSGTSSCTAAPTYLWTQKSLGPNTSTITPANAAATTVSGLIQGTYVFTLKVTDCNNQSVTDDVNVVVNSASTPNPGNAKIALNLFLHGIGKAGDSVRPGAAGGGNMSPKHPDRDVTVVIKNLQNQTLMTKTAHVKFDSTTGSFKSPAGSELDLGSGFVTGSYIVTVKFTQSLITQVPGAPTISANAITTLPATYLVTGDINNDGAVSLNVFDFNVFRNCIQHLACTAEQKTQSDLIDDQTDTDNLDQFDFSLFMREITHITNQQP